MTPACPRLLLALLPWCAAAALAQQPTPAPSAEAMERARRDAANPMRVILEAGRLQQRRRADAAPVPGAAPATATAPTPAPAAAAARRALPELAPVPAPVAAPAAEPVAAPVVEPEPEPVAAPSMPEPAAPPVTLPPADPPPVPRPVEAEVKPLPAVETEVAVEPTLLNLVEPAIPPGVLGRIGTLREVTADLSLRADGTVAAVSLGPTTPRAAARYLTQAFEQWRFAPLPAARVHRVQLVFNP